MKTLNLQTFKSYLILGSIVLLGLTACKKSPTKTYVDGLELKAIALVGNDVYTTGDTHTTPAYWKNGLIKSLPECNGITGIVVVTHPH